jgi:hypothetical protein
MALEILNPKPPLHMPDTRRLTLSAAVRGNNLKVHTILKLGIAVIPFSSVRKNALSEPFRIRLDSESHHR